MKKFNKVLLVLLFTTIAFLTVLPRAEAVRVTLDNRRNQKVSAAFIYYDVNEGAWCCHGWWNVNPYARRSINLPHHTGSRIYYQVQHKGMPIIKRRRGSISWDVISDAFKYYEFETCPYGKNYRRVFFNRSDTTTGNSWILHIN